MSEYAEINREIYGNGSGAKLPPFRGDVERTAPAPRRPRWGLGLLLAAVALLAVVMLAGCTPEQVALVKAQATELRGDLNDADEVVTGLRQTLDEAGVAGDAGLIADTRAALDKAEKVKADVQAKLDGFIAKTTEIEDGVGLAGAALTTAAPLIPGPYGLAAGLLGTVLAGYSESRRRRVQAAATDAIVAIERTKTDDIVDFSVAADELRSRMSTEARQLVERARDKAPTRPDARPLLIDIGGAKPVDDAA